MNLSGNQFEYDNKPSSRYGDLIIAEVETEAIRAMARDVAYDTIRDANGQRHYMGGLRPVEEPLSFDLEFIREEPLSRQEARDIARWLFHQPDYKRLYVARDVDDSLERMDNQMKRSYLECVFYNPQRIEYADGLHGWRCTCECATPMATQEEITKTFTAFGSSEDDKIILNVDTDAKEYVYPRISIQIAKDFTMAENVPSHYCLGDVDRDGAVSIRDVMLAEWIATRKIIPDEEQLALADIYMRGEVTAEDGLLLLRYVQKKIDGMISVGGTTVTIGETHPLYRSLGKDIYLENKTTGDVMKISNVFSQDILTIDCKAGTILNMHGEQPIDYYEKVADQAFPRLKPGANELDIYALDDNQAKKYPFASVSFSWNNARWIL